jgi:hypothetical protein
MTTRTELIEQLHCNALWRSPETSNLLRQCADMLEADGKLQAAARLALDALPPIFKAIKLLYEACSDLLMPGGTITTPTGLVITKPKEVL